jgi:predicted nuclease of predicted toxin-antitoxin system
LRLLLDEMYPTAIADQLRRRGHDVEAVTARPALRSLSDVDLFAAAQAERRVVVTENIGDFSAIVTTADQRGTPHHGLVLVDSAKYQRGNRRTVGRMVRRLDTLLRGHPLDEATGMRHWL